MGLIIWYLSVNMPNFLSFYFLPALAYMVVANPMTYQSTRSVLGSWVATQDGTAHLGGLVLHAVVFIVLVTLLMKSFPPKRRD